MHFSLLCWHSTIAICFLSRLFHVVGKWANCALVNANCGMSTQIVLTTKCRQTICLVLPFTGRKEKCPSSLCAGGGSCIGRPLRIKRLPDTLASVIDTVSTRPCSSRERTGSIPRAMDASCVKSVLHMQKETIATSPEQ